jgi:hypothetical protein
MERLDALQTRAPPVGYTHETAPVPGYGGDSEAERSSCEITVKNS